MPLRPIALVFVLACVAIAALALVVAIRGLRAHKWVACVLLVPVLFFGYLASLPVPYLLGIGAPHPVFNRAAPVPSAAVTYYYLPVIANGVDGPKLPTLFAIHADTGKLLWQYEMPSTDTVVSVSAEGVFAASISASKLSTDVFALQEATGTVLWQETLSGVNVRSAPLLKGDALLLSCTTGDRLTPQEIIALRPADGKQLWSVRPGPYDAFVTNPPQLILGPDPSILYDTPDATILEARSVTDGTLLWANTQVSGQVVVGSDEIVQVAQHGQVTAFSTAAYAGQSGAPMWSFGDQDDFHAAALVGDTLYVTGQHGGSVTDGSGKLTNPETAYALDARSGALRWKFATQSGGSGYLATCHQAIFVLADDGIHALRHTDGTVLWRSSPQSAWTYQSFSTCIGSVIYLSATLTLPPETLTILGPEKTQTYLYAVNAETGSIHWGVPVGPVITVYPHIVL